MQASVHPTSSSWGYHSSSFSGPRVRGETSLFGADGRRDASLGSQAVDELQNQKIRFLGDSETEESHKSVKKELMAGSYKEMSLDAIRVGKDEMRHGFHHGGETAGRMNLEREDDERKEGDATSLSKETGKHMRRKETQATAIGSRNADSTRHLCSALGACQRMCGEKGGSFQPSSSEQDDTDKPTAHQMV